MDYSQGDYEYNENEEYEDEESMHGGSERMYQNKHQYNIDKEDMYEEKEEDDDDDDEFNELEFSVNHSCIEPLTLKKMLENDASYIRRTMSVNDISAYERNIAFQRQNEEDEEEELEEEVEREYQPGSSNRGGYNGKSNHSHDINYSAHSQEDQYHSNRDDALLNSNNIQYAHIEELENNDNLKETPIKNVSHISEVSKSKENSDHQHHNKLHSNNSKTKQQEKEKDVNQEYFSQSKEDVKKYNNNNNNSQQYQQEQHLDNDNEDQTHSIITYDDKDKNSISQNESNREGHNYNDDNDDDISNSHERKYIGGDYYEDDDSMEVICVSFAKSEPPLQRKLKLSEPTESSDSFPQHLQEDQDDDDDDQEDENASNVQAKITYPTTSSQQLPDIDASASQNSMYGINMKTSLSNLDDDNNKSHRSKDAQHSKRSSNKKPKGVISNKSNMSSNRSSTNKKKQNYQHSKSSNKSLMNGTRSDISKSSFRSNNQNNSNSKHNKSSTSSLLDEIPLTDEEVKNELIKMTRKIYGNKLTPNQLKQSEEMFLYIIYNIKEALNSNNNENENEKYITKEFLLKHEKQLHALIVSNIDALKKKSNIKSQNMKTIARNIPTIKYIRELQLAQTADRIKRKQQGLLEDSGKIMQRDFEYFGTFYNQALQLEEMRCNDEMQSIEIKRQRLDEEKNKLFAENIKYFSDKIGILSYLLAREKKKNTIDKKRKESYLHSLKYLTKHEKRKLFEREIERIDEEDQREEDNVDNKQEQIQNLVNTYYSKK